MEKLELETVETETGNRNWKWKLETETGNIHMHCDIDLAGGPLSKESLCHSTAERSSYITSCPGLRVASLVHLQKKAGLVPRQWSSSLQDVSRHMHSIVHIGQWIVSNHKAWPCT